jgi:chromosome segregation ATPase
MDDVMGSLTTSVTSLPALQEDMRQVKDQINRLQDRQSSLSNRSEELVRQRQAELGRERQDQTGLVKRLDALEKVVARYENRWQAIEKAMRHLEDGVATSRQGQDQMGRSLLDLSTKTGRNVEAVDRLEEAAGKLANSVEALEQSSAALADRLSLVLEVAQRAEERLDALERNLPLLDELRKQQEGVRYERDQFTERVASLEQSLTEVKELSNEMRHLLGILQERTQQEATQLLGLTEEVKEYRKQVSEKLRRALMVMQRQKRRRSEALALEIKELTQSEVNAQDEQ